jgi:transposase
MVKVGECVVPVINLLHQQLLESAVIQGDETRIEVLRNEKLATAECWLWVPRIWPAASASQLVRLRPFARRVVSMRLFDGFSGIFRTDGCEAYRAVAQAKQSIATGNRRSPSI